MPDEQIGLGPAALEHPETDTFATKEESLAEPRPEAPEAEPAPETSGKYEKLLQKVAGSTTITSGNTDDGKVDLEHLQSLEGEEEKIEQLVKLAKTKGLPHAIRVAERLKDYYALDKFHDNLVDNLYDSLLKEGLITSE